MRGTDDQPDRETLPDGRIPDPEWEVGPRAVRRALDAQPRPLLLDVRTDQERTMARIEGSHHLPMHDLAARLHELAELAERHAPGIVVYCHTGRRSLRVAALLREAGFPGARSMAGGIEAWSKVIDPSVPTY